MAYLGNDTSTTNTEAHGSSPAHEPASRGVSARNTAALRHNPEIDRIRERLEQVSRKRRGGHTGERRRATDNPR
ncbi:MAG: hypothetical protein WAP37_05990, partial [Solirubrobacterales bacterium]